MGLALHLARNATHARAEHAAQKCGRLAVCQDVRDREGSTSDDIVGERETHVLAGEVVRPRPQALVPGSKLFAFRAVALEDVPVTEHFHAHLLDGLVGHVDEHVGGALLEVALGELVPIRALQSHVEARAQLL